MPSLRLTRRTIDEIPFTESGQVFYRGTKSKVYFAEGQVNRRTPHVTIGHADEPLWQIRQESVYCHDPLRTFGKCTCKGKGFTKP